MTDHEVINRDGKWVVRSLCPPRDITQYDHWIDAHIDLAILKNEAPLNSLDRSSRFLSTDRR